MEEIQHHLEIPENKNIFKISEAATILGVKPYVLRYWETEFQEARPRKSYSGQRVYTRDDILRIGRIRDLLYKSKYSIAGARAVLKGDKDAPEASGVTAATPAVEAKASNMPARFINNFEGWIEKRHEMLSEVLERLNELQTQVKDFRLELDV